MATQHQIWHRSGPGETAPTSTQPTTHTVKYVPPLQNPTSADATRHQTPSNCQTPVCTCRNQRQTLPIKGPGCPARLGAAVQVWTGACCTMLWWRWPIRFRQTLWVGHTALEPAQTRLKPMPATQPSRPSRISSGSRVVSKLSERTRQTQTPKNSTRQPEPLAKNRSTVSTPLKGARVGDRPPVIGLCQVDTGLHQPTTTSCHARWFWSLRVLVTTEQLGEKTTQFSTEMLAALIVPRTKAQAELKAILDLEIS